MCWKEKYKVLLNRIFKSDLLKNMSSLTLIQLANYAVPLLLIPYISRIVGVDNYGKLEYARVFVLYFTILIDYGFNYTATREVATERNNLESLRKVFSQVFVCKIILFVVSSLLFGLFIYNDDYLYGLRDVLFVTYLINVGFVIFPLWFFQGIEKIAFISIINFFIKIGVLALVIIFLRDKAHFWVYNLLQSFAQIIAGFYAFYLVFKRYEIRFVKVNLKDLLLRYKEGFAVFISTLLVSVITSYSFILMKDYVDETTIGVYSTAFKLIITIQTLLLVPFSQAFFPYMAKLYTEDIYGFKKMMSKATKLLLLVNGLAIVLGYFLAEVVISLLFGKEYGEAVVPFRYFLLLPLFACLTNLYSYQGLLNMKKDKVFLVIHSAVAILTIVLSYLIVPRYGLYGTIFLRVFLEILLFVLSVLCYRKYMIKLCN